jgi:hypothetical protein
VYITKYGIENLWKYNFLKNWRLMYFSCRWWYAGRYPGNRMAVA